jgi:hypothetical protein
MAKLLPIAVKSVVLKTQVKVAGLPKLTLTEAGVGPETRVFAAPV